MRDMLVVCRSTVALVAAFSLASCQPDSVTTASRDAIASSTSAVIIAASRNGQGVSLSAGDSAQLETTSSTRRGRIVRWSSSNSNVVSVNQQGLAIAGAIGSATVSAGGVTGTDKWIFSVVSAVASIAVTPDSVNIAPASTAQLAVVLRSSDGTVITDRRVAYSVGNAAVASVSATGAITAKALGVTVVTVAAGTISRAVRVVVVATAAVPPVTPVPPITPVPPVTPAPPTSGELGLNAALNTRRLFPADNAWNQPVDTAGIDPNSAAIIANIGATKSFHPDFGANYNGGPFGIPYFVVSNAQPGVNVTFDYDDESDHGLYPIPANAPIEGGASSDGDRHVIIVNRDTWKLYELYSAFPNSNGSWHAGSGALFDLASNALRPAGWTSADAAGLPILPGLVRYDEVSAGVIAHAIRFTVARSRKAYVSPARHAASSDTSSLRPPMGMRVRLKASVNIATYPASAQVILRALKKYGMIVADNGSDWYASGTADARWNDNEINSLKALKGSDFEVVRMTGVVKQ
jgi:hypothetical protein